VKREPRLLVLLLFLSPALGELLSSSSPPLAWVNPVIPLVLVAFYGGGTVLIREARARWHLQWSVIFLAVAYGILEEGTMMQSFFSHHHADLGVLSRYGMYGGIQWPWAIALTFYHATVSTMIPITIVDLLWPDLRDVPLLRKRGLVFTFLGVAASTILFMFVVWGQEKGREDPYRPDPFMLIGSLVLVVALIVLARAFRNSRVAASSSRLLSPFAFGILGFVSQIFNLILGGALAGAKVPATITLAVQAVQMAVVLLFVFVQIFHRDVTKRHLVSLVIGSLLLFILLSPIHELTHGSGPKPMRGMLVVGVVSLALLILWRRRVLRSDNVSSVSLPTLDS
jgi:hypothetical protein